jgi:hypothetical protein
MGEKLSAPQDLMKCLETRTESEGGSCASKASAKLVTMFVEDLERFHIELELHIVSGPRRRICLVAAVIDLYIVDVRVAELLKRLRNTRIFFFGGRTVRRGSRQSGLGDKKKDDESSNNCRDHFSTLTWSPRVFKSASIQEMYTHFTEDRKGSKEFSTTQIFHLFAAFAPFLFQTSINSRRREESCGECHQLI